MKYRKKPIVIEAFKWTGGPDQTEDPEWACEAVKTGVIKIRNAGHADFGAFIKTKEGTMKANLGDYIIKGIKGELYPCNPDIFEASYEPVVE